MQVRPLICFSVFEYNPENCHDDSGLVVQQSAASWVFFGLVVVLPFSLARFLEASSPKWLGNC